MNTSQHRNRSVLFFLNVISALFFLILSFPFTSLNAQNTPYYSITDGDWETPATWSTASHSGSPASTAPGAGCNVFIGDGSSYDHTVTVTLGSAQCDTLVLSSGSVLDLTNTTGNNFGMVSSSSTGKLRITTHANTAEFPAGDFSSFLGSSGGIMEYYSTTKAFTMPSASASPTAASLTSYYTLMFSLSAGKEITMPDCDLDIYQDMMVESADATTPVNLNNASESHLHIYGNLNIISGTLYFMNWNSDALDMTVDSNIFIASGATFTVDKNGPGADNTLTIGGNLINNGTFDMSGSQAFRAYPVIFTSARNTSISGTGSTTEFYALRLDKGSSENSILEVTSSSFTFANNDNPLILINGTFRLTSSLDITVAADTFDIPSTTRLSANGGNIAVVPAGTDGDDVLLDGTIEVIDGSIIIGDSTLAVNSDIIYGTTGSPKIDVSGGKLYVNGQIRRNVSMGSGTLSYNQSGSTSNVTIFGQNGQSGYAQLEVTNSGSSFNMSGGTLTLVRGTSSSVSDLLITPTSSTVTGGTIRFGTGETTATGGENTFNLESSAPLWNVTVDGTTTSKEVTLQTYDHTFQGNLLIEATSIFKANALDLDIEGNLINQNTSNATGVASGGFQPGATSQTTTFDGTSANQSITGVSGNLTNFGNLIISNASTEGKVILQTNTAVRLEGDLTINTGSTLVASGSDTLTACGNWVNNGDFTHSDGITIFDGTTTMSGSAITTFYDGLVTTSHSLTGPSSGTMRFDHDYTNHGTFYHNESTVGFTGSIQQITGDSANLFNNITIASSSTTTMVTPGQEVRGILLCNGTLSADNKLTLLSTDTQTALIDGTGTGNVTGTITMQRYLPSGFGYKYFSSPFQDATVGDFSDDMDLTASFPTFYSYHEEDTASGWDSYTTTSNPLEPLVGYAVNFGPGQEAQTVDISGTVNDGTLTEVTLYNNNETFTLGFNLIGNPYPSPIDWDATSGWNRTNIDDAIYYFNAGTTNQYLGTYSSYVNGISSDGLADNIIPSMQGVFIHVTDGTYPVTGSIQVDNQSRVNDLSPLFHKSQSYEEQSFLRISAGYAAQQPLRDPLVIRFDETGSRNYDPELDALKLMNTDPAVPNLFAYSKDARRLSIQTMPSPDASAQTEIALGIHTEASGNVLFLLNSCSSDLAGKFLYFRDKYLNTCERMVLHQPHPVLLETDNYDDRFSLIISDSDIRYTPSAETHLYVWANGSLVNLYVNLNSQQKGTINLYNLMGQKMITRDIYTSGYHTLNLDAAPAVYIVALATSEYQETQKFILSTP